MRKHGDTENAAMVPEGSSLLDYVPHVTWPESVIVPPVMPNCSVKLYAKSSDARPLQLIAATEPRGMDCTYTFHFKEAYELHYVQRPLRNRPGTV